MTGVAGVSVPVGAASARAGGMSPTAAVSVTPGGATAGGIAPVATAIIGPGSVLAAYVLTVPEPHPHLDGHKDNLIAYSVDVALAVVVLYVGGKIVVERTFKH
jgi:hypothetical protein